MSIHVYNSLTKTKEEFTPLHGKTVRMYSCGVTVYDQCHLGHARSLYVFDVIRRYLQYRGYDVRFIRNITDVDDKIIAKAKELGKASDAVATTNIDDYRKDLKSLGIAEADEEPRATQYIPAMVKHIQGLIEKGLAYTADGEVYFNVRKFKEYGKLSGQSIDQMLEGVRIEPDAKKKDPLDFALWKKSVEDEPGWMSPWGRGRPGWHMECSVMSMQCLKTETLDIHAGGRDLIFPHHENEIAQSEGLTGRPFAKYWIHHGLLTINGHKMAKSLGNFITIQDALKKYPVNELKLFFLSSHYASPIDFGEEKMVEAHRAFQRFEILFQRIKQVGATVKKNPSKKKAKFVVDRVSEFEEAMDDDFNTPRALAALFELVNETNKFLDEGKDPILAAQAGQTIRDLTEKSFGLSYAAKEEADPEIQLLLQARIEARVKKDFVQSDKIRAQLSKMGIVVEDTAKGQIWRKA